MYFYIYDSFIGDRKHERVMAAVEIALTDLGITGKIGRLTPFTNARGLVRDETRRGAKTIVAVGNDETISQVVAGLGDADVTLGLIPIGQPNSIARSLGIPPGAEACEVLSRRVIQKIDLGKINGQHFLWQVVIPPGRYTVEGEGDYRISSVDSDCEIVVSNIRSAELALRGPAALRHPGDPQDGRLDMLLIPKRPGGLLGGRGGGDEAGLIPLRRLKVSSDEPFAVVVDGRRTEYREALIEIAPARLKVITGKDRLFADG